MKQKKRLCAKAHENNFANGFNMREEEREKKINTKHTKTNWRNNSVAIKFMNVLKYIKCKLRFSVFDVETKYSWTDDENRPKIKIK